MLSCPFPIFSIEGKPHERGLQYGSTCNALIAESVSFYRRMFKHGSNLDWDRSLEKAAEFIPFIQAYDAEIIEEIEGIAEGSGRPVNEIVALNVRSELLFLLTSEGRRNPACCTSLALTPGPSNSNHMILAQNWDWYPQTQELCVVLKIEQEGRPRIIQLVEAGIIAKTGFNSAGIGLCTNALVSDQWRVGVPYHAILRGILNAETMAGAIGAITKPERASAGNYLIGHVDGEAINIEAAPTCHNCIFPDQGAIVHANHFKVTNPEVRDFVPSLWPDTIMREHRASKILALMKGQISISMIQTVLRDHFDKPYSICTHPDENLPKEEQNQTNASIIIDLNQKMFYIAKGPPCEHEYVSIRFNPTDSP